MVFPPAWQQAPPFGSNAGPVNPAFLPFDPNSALDSWLTLGADGPALMQGALTSIGIDFASWSETAGITVEVRDLC